MFPKALRLGLPLRVHGVCFPELLLSASSLLPGTSYQQGAACSQYKLQDCTLVSFLTQCPNPAPFVVSDHTRGLSLENCPQWPVMCILALGMVPSQWLTARGHKTLPPCFKDTNSGDISIPAIPVYGVEAGFYQRLASSCPTLFPLLLRMLSLITNKLHAPDFLSKIGLLRNMTKMGWNSPQAGSPALTWSQ